MTFLISRLFTTEIRRRDERSLYIFYYGPLSESRSEALQLAQVFSRPDLRDDRRRIKLRRVVYKPIDKSE
jgi:hypothetical protein